MLADTGGVNAWTYNREPTPLDHQPVIQQNRDTLYSAAVVDISKRATVTVPGSGGRYLAVMPINQDGYVNDPGEYDLTTGQFGTGYVMLPVRVLAGPATPAPSRRSAGAAVRRGVVPDAVHAGRRLAAGLVRGPAGQQLGTPTGRSPAPSPY